MAPPVPGFRFRYERDAETIPRVGETSSATPDLCSFTAAELARCTGTANPRERCQRLPADSGGVGIVDTPWGPADVLRVNQFGLYQIVMTGRAEQCRRFRDFAVREVVSSLSDPGKFDFAEGPSAGGSSWRANCGRPCRPRRRGTTRWWMS